MKFVLLMKKSFFILFFCFGLFCNLNSQTISYRYDNSGNRVERDIIEYSSQQAKKRQVNDTITTDEKQEIQDAIENENKKYEDDLFQEKKVIIYPNPTRGQLVVEIQNYDTETSGEISIYTTSGFLLEKKAINSSNIPLDIGNQPDGMYLLLIKMDGKTSSWKILKQ